MLVTPTLDETLSVGWPLAEKRVRLPRYPPLQPKAPSKEPVTRIDRLAIHERASAHDRLEPPGPAKVNGVGRYAAGAKGAMEPDVLDAPFDRRARDFRRDGRMRDDHDTMNRSWN